MISASCSSGFLAADQPAEDQDALFEQLPVAGEENAPLADRPLQQVVALSPRVDRYGVDPGHPQQSRQPAHIDIHQERTGGERLRSKEGGHGRRAMRGKRLDVVIFAVIGNLLEGLIQPVQQNSAHFGVGNAKTLDDVLDRSPPGQRVDDRVPFLRRA